MNCYTFTEYVRVTTPFGVMENAGSLGMIRHGGIDFGTVDLRKYKDMARRAIFAYDDGQLKLARKAAYVPGKSYPGSYLWLWMPRQNLSNCIYHVEPNFPVAEGSWVKKGDIIGYTGFTSSPMQSYGEHTHNQFNRGMVLSGLWNSNVLDPGPILANSVLRDKLNQTFMQMNIPAGATILTQVAGNMNLRDAPSLKGNIINKCPQNTKGIVTPNQNQNVVMDGYEWSPVKMDVTGSNAGWLAVQNMSNGEQFVKVVDLPADLNTRVTNLEALTQAQQKTIDSLTQNDAVQDAYLKSIPQYKK